MMTFDRDQERWFSIIISPKEIGKGLGKQLFTHVLAKEPKLCGWVADHDNDVKKDGTPYLSPLKFYLKLGFEVLKNERMEKPGISCVKIVSSAYLKL